MSQITEKTLIPLGLVIVFLGGVSWLTSISNRTDALAQGLIENREEMAFLVTRLEKIQDSVNKSREETSAIGATQVQIMGRLDRMSDFMQRRFK
jgi:hypothetical protein